MAARPTKRLSHEAGVDIFRKDVRRYWLEIVASLALMAAFGRFEVRGWWGDQGSIAGGFGFFGRDYWPGAVAALGRSRWIFLVIRVVQGESLVGDRQLWITRRLRMAEVTRLEDRIRAGIRMHAIAGLADRPA